jgi:hypothetical protein
MFRSGEWRFGFGALKLRMGLRVIVLEDEVEAPALPPLPLHLAVGEVPAVTLGADESRALGSGGLDGESKGEKPG